MFKNYLLTAYRNLLRFKLDSLLNISGLVIGLTAALLIGLFIRHEISYDRFWSDPERLYRIQTRWVMEGREDIDIVNSAGPLKAALQSYFPNEIETAARLHQRRPTVYTKEKAFTDAITFADPEILDIFDFKIVAGDAQVALSDNASIILNETLARKYFGDTDPIGRTLTLDNRYLKRDYRVLAVMRDLPANTHLDLQAMIKIDENDYLGKPGEWMFSSWNSAPNHTYVKLRHGSDINTLVERMDAFTDANLTVSIGKASDRNKFPILAVRDIHLRSDAAGDMKPGGDAEIVYAFSVIALLIVLVATVNYVNLSTARAGQRAREISMRKVMGATRMQLIFQQLGESTLVVAAALLLTLLLTELALPFFNAWLGLDLSLTVSDPQVLTGLLLALLVVGGLSGLYPALVLSSGRPSDGLRYRSSNMTGGGIRTRNILVIFQTAVTVGLVVATIVVFAQLSYFRWLDRGFEPGQLLVLRGLSNTGMADKQEAFRARVESLSSVEAASLSMEAPTEFYENNRRLSRPGDDDESGHSVGMTRVDPHYIDALGIPLLTGRFYSSEMALDRFPSAADQTGDSLLQTNLVINQRAVTALGLGSPALAIGQVMEERNQRDDGSIVKTQMTIIGVVGDAHLHSAKKPVRPEIYWYAPGYYHLLVRYSGTGPAALAEVRDVWEDFMPGEPFEYFFADQALAEEFQSETNQANIFLSFALLTMTIGCLGLYGLAAFVTECRRGEIGIRKILGAKVRDIITLLFGQFSKLVIIANLVAWPLTYLLMKGWLAQYPLRIPDTWIIVFCVFAGLLSSVVVAMTVGSQAWHVAASNPIGAIQHE